jgi:hypothetical protein
MERLVNCPIRVDIEMIDKVSGGNQEFEVFFTTTDKKKYRLFFERVWDLRYSIENGSIDRFSKFIRNEKRASSIVLVEDSDYIKYFEQQVSGTRPVDELKNYIMFDAIDTGVDILTLREPVLEELT